MRMVVQARICSLSKPLKQKRIPSGYEVQANVASWSDAGSARNSPGPELNPTKQDKATQTPLGKLRNSSSGPRHMIEKLSQQRATTKTAPWRKRRTELRANV